MIGLGSPRDRCQEEIAGANRATCCHAAAKHRPVAFVAGHFNEPDCWVSAIITVEWSVLIGALPAQRRLQKRMLV